MHGNVPVRFGRGRLDSLDIKGLAAYLIARGEKGDSLGHTTPGYQRRRPDWRSDKR
jgi:hypothetical protein